MRGLFICAAAESESFLRIHQAPAGHPLIVTLPAARDESCAFAKTIGTAEDNDDKMARVHDGATRGILDDFGFPMR